MRSPQFTLTANLQNLIGSGLGYLKITLINPNAFASPIKVSGTALVDQLTYVTPIAASVSVTLWGLDVLSPSNCIYKVEAFNSGNTLAWMAYYNNFVGSVSQDLSALTPMNQPTFVAPTFTTANANTFYAGPQSGGAGVPTMRSIVTADVQGVAVVDSPTAPQTITGQTLNLVSAPTNFDAASPIVANSTLHVVGAVKADSTLNVTGDAYFKSGRPWFDVRAFGATGNGSTNDSTNVQAAITAAAVNGGIVFFPPGTYKCNITVPNGVTLLGAGFGWCAPGITPIPSTLKSASGTGATAVVTITLSGGGTEASRIQGLLIQGNNTGTSDVGLLIPNATGNGTVEVIDTAFANFGQQAILQNGPGGHLVMNMCIVEGALSDKTSAIRRGAIEIHASNAQLTNVEVGAGVVNGATITNAALNNCALMIDGTYGIYTGVVAEEAELGIYLTSAASANTFVSCNANLNAGHGWLINDAGNNVFSNCQASNNGQATASTYDGFNLSAASGPNLFSNTLCIINGGFLAGRYGINDASTALPGNSYFNVRTAGSFTAPTNFGGAAGTSTINTASRISFDKGDANVSVTPLVDPDTTLYNSPLTANRTVTLNTTGAWNGAKFRTVRTAAATGASTLTVGSKVLAVGQWVDHQFASGAWFETGFGSL
jgi:parallel beta-helix repeat protein